VLGVQGQNRGKFDDRGRMPLGSKLKEQLLAAGQHSIVLTYYDGSLQGFTLAQWRRLEHKVARQPRFSKAARSFQLVFMGIANEVPLDKQGRVLIPQHLRKRAGLGKEAVVLSYMDTLEIWDPDRLEQRREEEAASLDIGTFLDDLVVPMDDEDE
jgi:MraZ protein